VASLAILSFDSNGGFRRSKMEPFSSGGSSPAANGTFFWWGLAAGVRSRLQPGEAARPALMGHAVESKQGRVFGGGGVLYTARARAQPPPPPLWGCAPGSNEPSGPRCRNQSCGPHRSRRQPTPLPGWGALWRMELVLRVARLYRACGRYSIVFLSFQTMQQQI
jgi:hypothetical protein